MLRSVAVECSNCQVTHCRCGGDLTRDAKLSNVAKCGRCGIVLIRTVPTGECPRRHEFKHPPDAQITYCANCDGWVGNCAKCEMKFTGHLEYASVICDGCLTVNKVRRELCVKCGRIPSSHTSLADCWASSAGARDAALREQQQEQRKQRERLIVDNIRMFIGSDRAGKQDQKITKILTDATFDCTDLDTAGDMGIRVRRLCKLISIRQKWREIPCTICRNTANFEFDICMYECGHISCVPCDSSLAVDAMCPTCSEPRGHVLRLDRVCSVNVCQYIARACDDLVTQTE